MYQQKIILDLETNGILLDNRIKTILSSNNIQFLTEHYNSIYDFIYHEFFISIVNEMSNVLTRILYSINNAEFKVQLSNLLILDELHNELIQSQLIGLYKDTALKILFLFQSKGLLTLDNNQEIFFTLEKVSKSYLLINKFIQNE